MTTTAAINLAKRQETRWIEESQLLHGIGWILSNGKTITIQTKVMVIILSIDEACHPDVEGLMPRVYCWSRHQCKASARESNNCERSPQPQFQIRYHHYWHPCDYKFKIGAIRILLTSASPSISNSLRSPLLPNIKHLELANFPAHGVGLWTQFHLSSVIHFLGDFLAVFLKIFWQFGKNTILFHPVKIAFWVQLSRSSIASIKDCCNFGQQAKKQQNILDIFKYNWLLQTNLSKWAGSTGYWL